MHNLLIGLEPISQSDLLQITPIDYTAYPSSLLAEWLGFHIKYKLWFTKAIKSPQTEINRWLKLFKSIIDLKQHYTSIEQTNLINTLMLCLFAISGI